jgi:hypothetical protein
MMVLRSHVSARARVDVALVLGMRAHCRMTSSERIGGVPLHRHRPSRERIAL